MFPVFLSTFVPPFDVKEYWNTATYVPQQATFLFIFVGLLIAVLFRWLTQQTNLPIPPSILLLFTGMLWGIGVIYHKKIAIYSIIVNVNPMDFYIVYCPALVFRTAFCIDAHAFFRSFPQIVIISFPVLILNSCFTGLIMRLVIDKSWPYGLGVVFGTLCNAIYPIDSLILLNNIGGQTKKYISILLEGEAIVGVGSVVIIARLLEGQVLGYVVWWYQYFMFFLRYLTLGPFLGYFMGLLGSFLMRHMADSDPSLVLITLTIPYIGFYISHLMATCSLYTVILPGVLMGLERQGLPAKTDKMLVYFWQITAHVLNTVLLLIVGVAVTVFLIPKMSFADYFYILITYLINNIARFVSFMVFYPILSRIGYGMPIENMVVLVWCGLKSPILLSLMLRFHSRLNVDNKIKEAIVPLCSHIVGVYILTLLINGTLTPVLLKVLGLSEISMARQVNMNNCLQYLNEGKACAMNILKTDRFLSDANWPIITAGTILKHPYKITSSNIDDQDDGFIGYRFSECPDCKKDILNEPTARELKEMTREARLRVLKAKIICYSRLQEKGLMRREGTRILKQETEDAMDAERPVIDITAIEKLFKSRSCFNRFIRSRVQALMEKDAPQAPPRRKRFRYTCFHVARSKIFRIFIYFIVFFNLVFIISEFCLHPKSYTKAEDYVFGSVNMGFVAIYVFEFIVRLGAVNWDHGCGSALKKYFSSEWNIIDFIVLLVSFIDVLLEIVEWTTGKVKRNYHAMTIIITILRALRLLTLLKLIKVFENCYPNIIRYFDARVNYKRTFAYELGKGYVNVEEEMLMALPYMVDNEKIKEEMKQMMERDKLKVNKLLIVAQEKRPWMAVTVKSRQAITTILNSMQDTIKELKMSGWVDEGEYELLMESLKQRYKFVATVRSIQPSPPEILFKEMAWMADEQQIINYLYTHVTTRRYNVGEKVCEEGKPAQGISIVVTGLLTISYNPQKKALEDLHEFGMLPVADFLPHTHFNEPYLDYIVSGNCVGELSTLTERPYNCNIVSDSHSQVYFLSREVIKKAMELSRSPVNGLECRIWRSIGISIALPILNDTPAYQSSTVDKVRFALERAFVPELSQFKMFEVNGMIEDIVLIEGLVLDYNTRDLYTAPIYIPRTVKKIVLTKSSLINVTKKIEARLLIIPTEDVSQYNIMMREEDVGEMLPVSSSRCLHHTLQRRVSRQDAHLGSVFVKDSNESQPRLDSMEMKFINPRTSSGSSFRMDPEVERSKK